MNKNDFGNVHLFCGDAIALYDNWESPTVIISDGPYGVNGFPGDLVTNIGLAEWYEPHIKKWSEKSTPLTTLWFWNTELGWATVHPMLEKYGWTYADFLNETIPEFVPKVVVPKGILFEDRVVRPVRAALLAVFKEHFLDGFRFGNRNSLNRLFGLCGPDCRLSRVDGCFLCQIRHAIIE